MPVKPPTSLGALGLPGLVSSSEQGRTAAPRPPALPGPSELSRRRAPAETSPATGDSTHPQPRGRQVLSGPPKPRSMSPAGSTVTLPGKKAPLKDPQLGKLDADGTLIGPQSRTQPLQPHEYQQAGYQLGAKLNGDAITDPDQRRQLADGTQTAHDVRVALKHGRGNVAADTLASAGYNGIATSASYRLGGIYGNATTRTFRSGMALAAGAGNCDQHSDIASRLHTEKLSPGETVDTVVSSVILRQAPPAPEMPISDDHVWTEVHTEPGKNGQVLPPIVIDPWGNGPAARLQDTAWAPFQEEKTVAVRFDAINGKLHLQKMQEMAQRCSSPDEAAHKELQYVVEDARRRPTEWNQYAEPQVIASEFAAGAREKLAAMSSLSQEIVAAGAGREAYNLSIKEATKLPTTTQIVDQAVRLDAQSRPPVVKPSY